jgi:hypothetical protein
MAFNQRILEEEDSLYRRKWKDNIKMDLPQLSPFIIDSHLDRRQHITCLM